MIDILFPTYERREFAVASLRALRANTDLRQYRLVPHSGNAAGPVEIMNQYLAEPGSEIFAKIDNDVIVPPGWLEAGLAVMEAHPELGLLGIEPPASRTSAPWAGGIRIPAPELVGVHDGYAPCEAIGGIGLMRRSAFAGRGALRPHSTYGGFTDWQMAHPEVTKGWIVPPLNVFLLDRLPIEPWVSLSKYYVATGWQRPWTNYTMDDSDLWSWWTP